MGGTSQTSCAAGKCQVITHQWIFNFFFCAGPGLLLSHSGPPACFINSRTSTLSRLHLDVVPPPSACFLIKLLKLLIYTSPPLFPRLELQSTFYLQVPLQPSNIKATPLSTINSPNLSSTNSPPSTSTMFATRALRQAAVHAERTPLIRFLGPRATPCKHNSSSILPTSPHDEGRYILTSLFSPQLQSTTLLSLTPHLPQESSPRVSPHTTATEMPPPDTTLSAPTVTTPSNTVPFRGLSAASRPALVAPLATSSAPLTLPRVLPLTSLSFLPASTASPST